MRVLGGWVAVGGAVAAALLIANCGSEEPTQIVVSVDATPAECGLIQKTLVRVDSLEESASAATEKPGCDQATNHIGQFVLVPRNALDADVKFQVVTGVGKNPDNCRAEDPVDCIVAKRITRFVPHETVRMNVLMAGACRGKACAVNETCDESGQCVSTCNPPSSCPDAGPPVKDAAPDAPQDKCSASGCLALTGATCRADGVCEVKCGLNQKCDLKCPPGLQCVFNCEGAGACSNVSCEATSVGCVITCNGASACTSVDCAADSCRIACDRQSFQSGSRGCVTVTAHSKNPTTITCASTGCGTLNCNGPGRCECPQSDPNDCKGSDTLCNTCNSGGSN